MVDNVLPRVHRTNRTSNKASGVVGKDMEPRGGMFPRVIFIYASHSIFDKVL